MTQASLPPDKIPPTPTAGALPPQESTSAMGRVISKAVESEVQLIAVPLNVASAVPRVLSVAAHPLVIKGVGGAGYLISGLANYCFRSVRRTIEVMQQAKVAEAAVKGAGEAVRLQLEQVEAKKQAESATVQAGATGVKWATKLVVSLVPGLSTAGVIAEGAADAASKIAEIKREAESASLAAGKLQAMGGLKVSHIALNLIANAGWAVAFAGEKATEWLKTLSIRAWQDPSALSNMLTRAADKLDAWSFKITHAVDSDSFLTQEPSSPLKVDAAFITEQMVKEITPNEEKRFCRAARLRHDAISLIKHYRQELALLPAALEKYENTLKAMDACGIDDEKWNRFFQNSDHVKNAREILALYNSIKNSLPALYAPATEVKLPINAKTESKKVAPNEVQAFLNLPDAEQSAILKVVRESKKVHLSREEAGSYQPPIEDEAKIREVIGLFKALPVGEKEAILPPLEAKITVNAGEAANSVTDEKLAKNLPEIEDILFKAIASKTFALSAEQKTRYTDAVQEYNLYKAEALSRPKLKNNLKELLGVYERLPRNERNTLTPGIYKNLDETLRLEIFHLVSNHAANLSVEERKFITDSKMREVHLTHSFQHLKPEEKAKLERFLIEKFNTLSPNIKTKMYDLSFEAFIELPEMAKERMLETLAEMSGKKPTSYSRQEMEPMLAAFNSKLSLDDKIKVYSALQQSLVFLYLDKEALQDLISTYKTARATLPPDSPDAKNITRMIDWLSQTQTTEVKKVTPIPTGALAEAIKGEEINLAKIEAAIGSHIMSEEEKSTLSSLGSFAHNAFSGVGRGTQGALNAVGYLSSPWWTQKLMTSSATAMEFLLAIAPIQRQLMCALTYIPGTMQLEYGLQILPQILVGGLNKLWELALGGTSSGAAFLDEVSRVQNLMEMTNRAKGVDFAKTAWDYNSRMIHEQLEINEAITTLCKEADATSRYMCRPEVLEYTKSFAGLRQLAADYGLTYGSAQFYEFLKKFITLRDIPSLPKAPAAPPIPLMPEEETTVSIMEGIKNNAEAVQEMVTNQLYSYMDTFLQTSAGQIAYHAAQSVIKGPLGVETAAILGKAKGAAVSAKDITMDALLQGAAMAGTGFRVATGAEQLLPAGISEGFAKIADIAAKLAAVKAEQAGIESAITTLQALQKSDNWYEAYLLLPAAKYLPVEKIKTLGGYADFRKIISYLESFYHASKANELALKSQLGRVSMEDLQKKLETSLSEEVKQTMTGFALKASSQLVAEGALSWKKIADKGLYSLSVGGSIAELAAMTMGATFFLPLMMRHLLPSLLRTYAPVVSQAARPFWYGLAKRSYDALDATGGQAEKAFTAAGSFMLELSKMAAGKGMGYVSPLRVENFLKTLTVQERTHLVDLAIHSSHVTKEEKAILEGYRAKMPHQIDAWEYEKLAHLTLQVYDRFWTSEKLRISPSSFDLLPQEKKDKVIAVVDHYIGILPEERFNNAAILKKYYQLSSSQQQKVDEMTIWEYAKLSSESQEDIRFIISNSQTLRKHYQVSAAENDGFKSAWSAFLEEQAETDIEKLTWNEEHFHKMASMPNSELQKLLSVYHRLPESEKMLLTPSLLGKMSNAKILHCLELLQTYHPELVHDLRGKYDLEKLEKSLDGPKDSLQVQKDKKAFVEGLALAFRLMPVTEQNQFFLMTEGELKAFTKEEKFAVLQYLSAQPTLAKDFPRLKNELVKLEKGKDIDLGFVTGGFNTLETANIADFRQKHELGLQAQKDLIETCQTDLTRIMSQLKVLAPEIDRLRKIEFTAVQLEFDNAKKALNETRKKLALEKAPNELTRLQGEETKQAAALRATEERRSTQLRTLLGLEQYRDRLLTEAQVLQNLVGKEYKIVDMMEDELFSPVPHAELALEKQSRISTLDASIGHMFESKKQALIGIPEGLPEFHRRVAVFQTLLDNYDKGTHQKLKDYQHLRDDLQSRATQLSTRIEPLTEAASSMSVTAMQKGLLQASQNVKDEVSALKQKLDQSEKAISRLKQELAQTKEEELRKSVEARISPYQEDVEKFKQEIKTKEERAKQLDGLASEKLPELLKGLQGELATLEYERIDAQMKRQVILNFWEKLYVDLIATFQSKRALYQAELPGIEKTYKAD